MPKALDLSNKRFGKLIALKKSDRTSDGQVLWLCKCDCGNHTKVRASSLKRGLSKSCGCMVGCDLRKHGLYKHKLYGVWISMRQRCNNPNATNYSNYGAIGVEVCDEWSDFQTFYDWAISNGYQDGLVIDRIDTYGSYGPNNCRWITQAENCQNSMIQSNNTSGYIGVSQLPDGRFRVYYTLNAKRKQIGIAKTALEGSKMRARYFAKHKIGLRNGI